jgi:hypothetical protein
MKGLLIAALAAALRSGQQAPATDHLLFEDAGRDVRIRYDFTPAGVEFSAHLPAGWTFSVAIDGDQDGRCGEGQQGDRFRVHSTVDRKFAQDSRNGVFCSAYVLSASTQDPGRIYASTECGGLPSGGTVVMTGFDARMRATITFRIPTEEIFGGRPNAHLQICLWDTQRWTCRYTPANPFVLQRPAGPAPG